MVRGEVNEPVVKNPSERSVDVAVIPLAQLIAPPEDVPLTTPVPVVPYAKVVTVVAVLKLRVVFSPNPVGRLAVPLLPIPSKF